MISQLNTLILEDDFHGIISLTKELPAEFSRQPDIIRSRVVAFIRLEKYDDALKCIQSTKLGFELVFEEAYCLYRLNKLTASLDLLNAALDSLKSRNSQSALMTHLSHLKAQVCYRLELFDESLGIYKQLPLDEDVEANIMAVEAVKLACSNISDFDLSTNRPTSYAGLFNLALYQLSKDKDYQSALKTLEESARQCAGQLSIEGYDDSDIEKELLVISCQKAYVLQMMGMKNDSLKLYEKLLVSNSLDPVIISIATNNLQVLKGAHDVVDVAKALKLIRTPSILAKLNSSQIFFVELNGLIYSLLVGKNSVAASKLAQMKLKAEFDLERMNQLVFIEGSMLLKQSNTSLKVMEKFVADNPSTIAAHQYLLDCLLKLKNFHAAENLVLKLLENSSFEKYRPGLLSLLVWLFEKSGQNALALDALEKFGHKSAKKSFEELRQIADFKMKLGRYVEAMHDLNRMYSDFPKQITIEVEALRLLCLGQLKNGDCDEMRELTEKLEPYCTIEKVEYSRDLEQIPGKTPVNEISKTEKKMKRKRVKPLPKNIDPNRIPDPERWLSKKMRKGTQTAIKGKDGKEEVSGFGFQGVSLKGGGIGGTGSSRIAGLKVVVAPVPTPPVVVEAELERVKRDLQTLPSKKSKGKRRK